MTFEAVGRITESVGRTVSEIARTPSRRRPALNGRSLAILWDLGMSDAQIARYFGVSERRVTSLRRYYGIA